MFEKNNRTIAIDRDPRVTDSFELKIYPMSIPVNMNNEDITISTAPDRRYASIPGFGTKYISVPRIMEIWIVVMIIRVK